jgi:hypothetical protein
VAQFAAEEQVVGRLAPDRDAQGLAVKVVNLPCRAVLAHQVGTFDLDVGRAEGDAVGARRIDGQEGQVPAIFAGRSDHRGCGVVTAETCLHADALRQCGWPVPVTARGVNAHRPAPGLDCPG